MTVLPTPEEQEWLLDHLAELLAQCGADAFVAGPILEPDARHFPDHWEPNARGVFRMARRLLVYARLDHLKLRLTRARPPDLEHRSVAAWFAGIEDSTCSFGINPSIERVPERVAAAMAHEVAHAYRLHRGVVVDDDHELEELLTDVTTVLLGFGVLSTNAADMFRTFSSGRMHHWISQSLGYLPPQALAFLLAAQVRARDMAARDCGRIRAALECNQRASFDAALRALPPPEELRKQLGIGEPASWPASAALARFTHALSEEPLETAIADEEKLDVAYDLRTDPRPVFRLRSERRETPLFALVLIGGPLFIVATMVGIYTENGAFFALALGGVLLGIVGVAYMPRRERRTCSDPNCGAPVDEHMPTCPRCKRTFRGEVRSRKELLAREDALIDAGIVSEVAADDEDVEFTVVGDGSDVGESEDEQAADGSGGSAAR